jgi:Phage integrase family
MRRIRYGVTCVALTMAAYVATYRGRDCWWTPRKTRRSVRSAAPAPAQEWPWTARRRPVMEASGLPYRKPHNLRHTYASLLLAKGVSVAYVQAQLGHHSIQVTVDTYGHFIPGARVRFVDQLDDITGASPPLVADEAKAHKPNGVTTAGNSVRAAEGRDISPKTRCSDTAVSCG